jgi:hypothetical protein
LKKLLKYLSIAVTSIYSCFSQGFVKPGLTEDRLETIVEIIWKIEGKNKTKYLYGIKSVKIKGNTYKERKNHAKSLCKETVINNYNRWIKEANSEPFYKYLGSRYCPKEDSIEGYNNWIRNFKYFAKREGVLF